MGTAILVNRNQPLIRRIAVAARLARTRAERITRARDAMVAEALRQLRQELGR